MGQIEAQLPRSGLRFFGSLGDEGDVKSAGRLTGVVTAAAQDDYIVVLIVKSRDPGDRSRYRPIVKIDLFRIDFLL